MNNYYVATVISLLPYIISIESYNGDRSGSIEITEDRDFIVNRNNLQRGICENAVRELETVECGDRWVFAFNSVNSLHMNIPPMPNLPERFLKK